VRSKAVGKEAGLHDGLPGAAERLMRGRWRLLVVLLWLVVRFVWQQRSEMRNLDEQGVAVVSFIH
jgi:hypothetical protein